MLMMGDGAGGAQWRWWYVRSGSRLSSLALQASNSLLSPLRSHLGCGYVSTGECKADGVVAYRCCFDEFAGDEKKQLDSYENRNLCGICAKKR